MITGVLPIFIGRGSVGTMFKKAISASNVDALRYGCTSFKCIAELVVLKLATPMFALEVQVSDTTMLKDEHPWATKTSPSVSLIIVHQHVWFSTGIAYFEDTFTLLQ
jgi:hypothetical protein